MWYAKMYFSEGREIFQYDSLGTQAFRTSRRSFPFWKASSPFRNWTARK